MSSVLFLMGPTASGKTALAVALAQALNGEIISVDSALVYRGLDIGTAKPSQEERGGITHHLIDVCEPTDAYSAARFVKDATELISDITHRGRTPILAGGTMLYFQALEKGLSPLPEANAQIRQQLVDEANHKGWESLHEELAQVDPRSAARIHPNDPQRLQRALEVYRISGQSLSTLQEQTGSGLSCPKVKLALLPESRQDLHKRIERRFDCMLSQGFVEEVLQLKTLGLDRDLPAMRAVGYRQAFEHLAGDWTFEQFREKAIVATRQLAKRQLTWLRGMDDVMSIPSDTLSLEEQLSAGLTVIEQHEH
ncbi:MAG: tRNA (adenosine(37)-N6)-dimethylallyltransferase MiaA [Gammaproteobacteria bacterium]|nr:tRNA (adenosine(37)-N6)-dimethylallyltransferase MiaA [Gammaproteobacteria bacterium]